MMPTLYHTVSKQRFQCAQRSAIHAWNLDQPNIGTAGRFQHPLRYLKGLGMLGRLQTTSEGGLLTYRTCFVDPNCAAVPRMPPVTDFPRISAMGIVSMSCITALARISHWTRMRRIHAVYSSPTLAASSPSPKWAGCITGTNAERLDKDSSTLRERTDTGCSPVCIQQQDAVRFIYRHSRSRVRPSLAIASRANCSCSSSKPKIRAVAPQLPDRGFRVQHPSERRRWNLREAQSTTT
jgi:hypothetical protein